MITLTQVAARRIQGFLSEKPAAKGFKIALKKYGCSGWGYDVSLPTIIDKGDLVFTDKGISIIVPESIVEKIQGMTIDYEKQGINYVFTYNNPQATGSCGCGESFTTN